MNKIERFFYSIGRLRTLLKGVDAPLSAPTSWGHSSMWGQGLASLGRKPQSKQEAVEQFTSWVFVCARVNATSIASTPLALYVSKDKKAKQYKSITTRPIDRIKLRELKRHKAIRGVIKKAEHIEEVTDHAFVDLMQNVNPFMNSSDLMEFTSLDMDLTGEAYWYVLKGNLGQPFELWPVPSQYINPIPGKSLKEFVAGYKYRRGTTEVIFDVDEIIQFSYVNPANQFQGFSCLRGVIDAVYTNSRMHEYEEQLFVNKARIGGILEAEGDIQPTELDRLRGELDIKYAGNQAAGKMLILPPGLTYSQDAMTNEELSFIEGRKEIMKEVCAGFDIPTALFDPDAIRANVEGAQYFHAKYGLLPRLTKIEEKLNEKLLPMFDNSGVLFATFENPVPEDKEQIRQERETNINTGVVAINEERAEMGKAPVEGGDEPLVQFNRVPLSQVAAPKVAPPPDNNEPVPGDIDADADKIATLTIQKLKERLGAGAK